MKKKLFIVLGILAAIVLIGFITLKIMSKNAERHVETENGIPVTAAVLATDYATQEDNANKKYLNKTLEITGLLAAADSNETHQTVLLLKDPGAVAGVSVTFKKHIDAVAPGSTITVKGICTGFLSNVIVTDGILLNIAAPPAKLDTTAPKPVDTPVTKPVKDTVKTKAASLFTTSKAQVAFDAGGGVEDIKATNNQVEATINSDGTVRFKLAILGFKFSDALMQEHFNDNYLESKKYPTASFSGSITNIKDIDLEKNGVYKATVSGQLTLHGVTQKINTTATLTVQNGRLKAQGSLNIKVEDYQVSNDATSSAVLTITANF
jgi:polyisoprenoid-binding protein YceI